MASEEYEIISSEEDENEEEEESEEDEEEVQEVAVSKRRKVIITDGSAVRQEDNGKVCKPVRKDKDEKDKFELIERVRNRPVLYEASHPDHKRTELTDVLWNQLAEGLIFNNKKATGKKCKDVWKNLRDYYGKKKNKKGKSGQSRPSSKRRPWPYFAAMDAFLRNSVNKNESTISNMEESDVESTRIEEEFSESQAEGESCEKTTDNPTPNPCTKSSAVLKTRRYSSTPRSLRQERLNSEAEERRELIDLMKKDGNDDEFYHFGMQIAAELRDLPPQQASFLKLDIMSRVHNAKFCVPESPAVVTNDNTSNIPN